MATGSQIYWDACVFIAWLMDEPQPHGTMEAVEDCVHRADKGQLVIMTSVITKIEVLKAKLKPAQQKKFSELFNRPSYPLLACDDRVAEIAHNIRSRYSEQGKDLTVPDCIHLATAIHYQAIEMHTFDGKRGKEKDKSKTKLLTLSGNVAGYHLPIVMPYLSQPSLLVSHEVPVSGDESNTGTGG